MLDNSYLDYSFKGESKAEDKDGKVIEVEKQEAEKRKENLTKVCLHFVSKFFHIFVSDL